MKKLIISVLTISFINPSTAQNGEFSLELPNDQRIEFALLPAGKFLMGSTQAEIDSLNALYYHENLGADGGFLYPSGLFSDEGPQHEAELTRNFYIGITEVTQGQWFAVMEEAPALWGQAQLNSLSSFWNLRLGGALPVGGVSWEEANAFAAALTDADPAARYRLPTEAEWEYAARAGSLTPWSFGKDLNQLGEYMAEPCSPVGNSSIDCTISTPTRTSRPNAWGLFDIHGSAWEWVGDFYQTDYYSHAPRVDPRGPETGHFRVIRGGSSGVRWKWTGIRSVPIFDGVQVRSTVRNPGEFPRWDIGFRLVREVSSPSAVGQHSWGEVKSLQAPAP